MIDLQVIVAKWFPDPPNPLKNVLGKHADILGKHADILGKHAYILGKHYCI